MADLPAQANLNEAALKRLDPYVEKVIDTAKFVALYTFKLKENKWERTGVEGSLFVYSRTGEPFYNILVLNRLNTTNLIEPISSKLTLQLHEPFLLYLNSKCCLYGMWFYEKEECTRLAALIEKLMKELGDRKESLNNVKPPNGSCLDICNILSRAQEAYNNSKTTNEGKKASNQEAEQTPQSVMDFFAKAGNAPNGGSLTPSDTGPDLLRALSHIEDDKCLKNPLIHHLMSNPVHLVEHIEKQQRQVTTPEASDTFRHPSHLSNLEHTDEVLGSGKIKLNNGCNHLLSQVPTPPSSNVFPHSAYENSSIPATNFGGLKKPALMPPAMFIPNSWKESCNSTIRPEPLTRNQLFQAINYLLKNDPSFVTKIHEAYIKSFNR